MEDKEFVEKMNQLISKCKQENVLDPAQFWEALKISMQNLAMDYGKLKAFERKKKLESLRKRLHTQEKRLTCINLQANNAITLINKINQKIDGIKEEIQNELSHKVQGAMIRVKVKWYEDSEKMSKYFFSLEKFQAKNRAMTATRTKDGSITRNCSQILEQQKHFYEKLYTKDDSVHFAQTNSPVKISEEQRLELDKEITMHEFSVALKETKNGTSPGLDGWTTDFLKMFYLHLREPIYEAFMWCVKVKRLFQSARRGVLALLPKVGRDILLVCNWRPISLLCVDYKLYTKVLANRLKSTLNTIISEDQMAFVEGRNISDHVRRVLDIMEITKHRNVAALLISLDLEKAFDQVNYESLFRCMKYFGFGDKFVFYNSLLFVDFNLCTSNAGHMSSFWTPTEESSKEILTVPIYSFL